MHKAPEKELKEAFVASRKGNEFCSQKYKNQFNVYKSREKKKGNKRAEHIFIGSELPEEYTESESRKSLMGANAKASTALRI